MALYYHRLRQQQGGNGGLMMMLLISIGLVSGPQAVQLLMTQLLLMCFHNLWRLWFMWLRLSSAHVSIF